jgi:hypothetical protein
MPGVIESIILFALTAGLPGLSNVALGLLTSALTYGVLAGGSALLNLAFQKKPTVPKPQDIQANIRQPLFARRRHHGEVKVGSGVVFGSRRGAKLYILHYIGEGPVDSFQTFYLNNKAVTLNGSGFVTDAQYQYGGRSRVQILTKLGTMADGPFSQIISAFPELDRPLKPFRTRGCAMALQIVEEVPSDAVTKVYPNNLPSLQVRLKGLKAYDPRSALTAWTENAALCLLNEIMDVFALTSADGDKIDLARFGAFASHCDEAVALKAGGTELRYRAAGTILMDAENESRIEALALACNADVYMDPLGRIAVRKKVSATPGIALLAKNGDHLSIALESGRRAQNRFNKVSVSYTDKGLNWKENQAFYINDANRALDGKELTEPRSILMCPSSTQAQRLGKLIERGGNPALAGSMTTGMQGLELLENPVLTIDLAPEDSLSFIARSGAVEFDADRQVVTFNLASVAADAESWNAALEERDWVESAPVLPTNIADVPLTVTVNINLLNNSAPVLDASWIAAGAGVLPDSYSQQIQFAIDGTTDWLDANVNNTDNTARFGPVADGGSYTWRIRNIRAGIPFDWQAGSTVLVTVDTVAPLALDSVTAPASGLGSAAFTLVTKTDSHLGYIRVFKNLTGTLNEATDAHVLLGVAPGSTFGYVDGDATRVNAAVNPGFDSDVSWTKGTGFTISGGKANKAAGTGSDLSQAQSLTAALEYRVGFTVSGRTAGSVKPKFTGGTQVNGTARSANGTFTETLTALAGNNTFAFEADAAFNGSIDAVVLYAKSGSSLTAGVTYYWFKTLNRSLVGNAGGLSGPFAVHLY